MGNWFGSPKQWLQKLFLSRMISYREVRILVLGLDGAGKSTVLYRMQRGVPVYPCTTIGFNVETVRFKNLFFTMWDVGGQERIRPLWRCYFRNTNAVIFVVDSNDKQRLFGSEFSAAEELEKLLKEPELAAVPVLILANKRDYANVPSVQAIAEVLKLHKIADRKWNIIGTNAVSGAGLEVAFDWLAASIL